MRPPLESPEHQAMDEINGPLEPIHIIEQRGDIRIILDDLRKPEDRQPVTIQIVFKEKEELRPEWPTSPLVRVIHKDELVQMMESENESKTREEELLTFGESVTLLIAFGVLIYLIYALLWPERF
jgi:K+-transporting ATPase KdpF subunit